MSKIKFNTTDAAFFVALRQRVDAYFKGNDLKFTGNFRLYLKTFILITTFVALYTILVFFTPPSGILSIVLCAIMGANIASIGFNVMHDGAHGSYSSKPWVNEFMGYTLNVLGGNVYIWKLKHNVNHHSFTNVEGMDDDIDIKPFLRVNASQPKYWFHRFQHLYVLVLYCLTYLFWIFFQDMKKYFTSKVSTHTSMKKMNLREHFIFWITKVVYLGVFIVIPVSQVGVLDAIIGYLVICLVAGFVLSIVFQLAHVLDDSDFVIPTNGAADVESNWAIYQINTTANFGTKNRMLNWFIGGLNFQVEHHLFPRISHVHYPQINKIIQATCQEYNIRYREFPSLFSALRSHLVHLKKTGIA